MFTLTLSQIESLKPVINGIVIDWSTEIEVVDYDDSITNMSYEYQVKALTDDARQALEMQGYTAN